MVPHLSRAKAKAIAKDGTRFSCPLKLLEAYEDQNLSITEKRTLLEKSFGSRGSDRQLSKQIYNLFNQHNPESSNVE